MSNKKNRRASFLFVLTLFISTLIYSLSAQAQSLPEAITEIRGMMKEVKQLRQEHRRDTFDHPTLWICYYAKKGAIPPPHFLNNFIKPDQIEVPGYRTLNEEDQKDTFTHTKEVIERLEKSIAFLEKYAGFYEKFPPVFEMNYLRSGINAWKQHLMSYHNILDQYFTDIALYARYIYYDRNVVYKQKLQDLETEYAGRQNDEKLQKQFEKEKAKIDAWRIEIENKGAKLSEQSFNMATGSTFRAITEHSVIDLFHNLEDEFLLRLILFKLNDSYIEMQASSDTKKIEQITREIETLKTAAQKKYGKEWKYLFRNPQTGKLPGGLIEDGHFGSIKSFYYSFFPETEYRSEQFKTAVREPDIKDCQLCQTFKLCQEQGFLK